MKTLQQFLKSTLLIICMFAFAPSANGQFLKKLGKRAEKAAERVVERRVEQEAEKKTDAALDSILEPDQKKKRKPKSNKKESENTTNDQSNSDSNDEATSPTAPSSDSGPKSIKVYSKFDFVAGDKLLFFDDFGNDFTGDFPSKWNSNGSGEIVLMGDTHEKWMELKSGSGTFYIPDTPDLPDEFTVEFDFLTTGLDRKTSSGSYFIIRLDDNNGLTIGKNLAIMEIPLCQFIARGIVIESRSDGQRTMRNTLDADLRQTILSESHISMAINKQRVRLWINEKKYVDIPRLLPDADIKAIKFSPIGLRDGIDRVFVRNLKVAKGGVDLRRKLIAEGKVSTNGILFDSGSANIQPQSMGIIRQISQVLQQENGMNLKIVGHTDADGDDSANKNLSKKRADAVKNALVNVYNVSADRLQTDGKGESEPVGDNATTDGKAQNRRVEFIKQ
ncbi:Flagellar motor rotation protein MotB [hydrothermal vent metagenome]|uniref:Flagellar motor rotation protein MotB n=1 Tax=hydrothermal vent metagenome TaxID=652676 RepID=A0A3B0T456_9ZZZZ